MVTDYLKIKTGCFLTAYKSYSNVFYSYNQVKSPYKRGLNRNYCLTATEEPVHQLLEHVQYHWKHDTLYCLWITKLSFISTATQSVFWPPLPRSTNAADYDLHSCLIPLPLTANYGAI